ncbi:TIGR02452 family protein [Paenibacillus pinisoli]|uniref:TIGR02452 family protein n=1 Tax=Paenibacillus pinisoli TaxID=1276110 RepID=A0A3A6PKR5_9BACL|nr:TIGR02452 family protein [Paenibacillus pinisoli]RJX38919.1 TIGR02452 family protein [Paenibacillus pinisoli]
MNRNAAARVAEETLTIIEQGHYRNANNKNVDIGGALTYAIEGAVLYRIEDTDQLLSELEPEHTNKTIIEVTEETTLEAAARLAKEDTELTCLNFASAKHPGGGFLTGARAQEESLARASGLYPTIAQMKEMYSHNAGQRTCLYSDFMIYSPKVPVFRDDSGALLDEAYPVSIITAPAVNAGVVREREPHNIALIDPVMRRRIDKVLAVAQAHKQTTLVLGAYGCGVFRNNPEEVAAWFRQALTGDKFRGVFRKVVFAIYDTKPGKEVYRAFVKQLT